MWLGRSDPEKSIKIKRIKIYNGDNDVVFSDFLHVIDNLHAWKPRYAVAGKLIFRQVNYRLHVGNLKIQDRYPLIIKILREWYILVKNSALILIITEKQQQVFSAVVVTGSLKCKFFLLIDFLVKLFEINFASCHDSEQLWMSDQFKFKSKVDKHSRRTVIIAYYIRKWHQLMVLR